jgi:WD40 repeat protein
LRGHSRGITHLAWHKDGGTVVSAGPDGMFVWGLDVDQALRTLD